MGQLLSVWTLLTASVVAYGPSHLTTPSPPCLSAAELEAVVPDSQGSTGVRVLKPKELPYPRDSVIAQHGGHVVVTFVVDTLGGVDPCSIEIHEATHPAFAETARAYIPGLRFQPGTRGGRKVNVLVRQRLDWGARPEF